MVVRLLLLTLLLGGAFGALYHYKMEQMSSAAAMMSRPRPPTVVSSALVEVEMWRPRLKSVGSLVAVEGTEVAGEGSGIVTAIHFDSADRVKRGALLVELDRRVDEAQLAEAEANRRLASIRLERLRDLFERKAVARSEVDEAQAGLDAAEARIRERRAQLARKSIYAPFNGQLGLRQVHPGDYLSPGEPVASIHSLTTIYLDYTVPEAELSRLAVGREVDVLVAAWPEQTFPGKVVAIAPAVDNKTRTLQIRALLDNPGGQLRPGMFAEVRTYEPELVPQLTIPRGAVSYNTYGDFVYLVMRDGDKASAKRRQLVTGRADGDRVVVVDGLDEGDEVVSTGLVKLRDGASIRIDNRMTEGSDGGGQE
jgi:membrane fusion protein (multidrug efflux system)